ncbi:glycosyltransferase family 2 protein [Psychroflexus sp. MBR-150]|jgi:glycosyltransferase involved in cell wall biosynthesis
MAYFSVILPVYNKANFLKETIQSVLNQTYKDFELVIVNDGSTDKSLEVIKDFGDKRIKLHNQVNKGASIARNKGVEIAECEWVSLLDADDIWSKNHLEETYKAIQKLSHADLVSTAYSVQLEQHYIKKPVFSKAIPKHISYIDNYFEYSLIDPLFWTSTLSFKKSSFNKIGGFDVDLKTGEDIDLIIRFALNYKLGYNPKFTLLYKKYTEHNLSSISSLEETYKYIHKHKLIEKQNISLKHYLDINRYSLALQSKINNNKKLYKNLVSEIDKTHLTTKHLFLLNCPKWMLLKLKCLQKKLIKAGVYKSAFN